MFLQIFLSILFDYFLLFIFDWKKIETDKKKKKKEIKKKEKYKNNIVIKFEKYSIKPTKKLSNIC